MTSAVAFILSLSLVFWAGNGNELATAWNRGYSAIFGWNGNHLVAFLDGRLHLHEPFSEKP